LRNNILNQPVLQICLYDLATNTERRLTDEVGSPRGDADIEGNYAVWHDYRNGNMDIYLYDLATNTERQLTTDVAYQGVPAISGTNVVYQDARNEPGTYGNDDIYLTAFAVPKIVVSMPSILSYNGRATVTGTFKDANGGPLAGKPVRIQYSSNGVSWSSMPLATTTASGAFVAYTPYLTSARYVRVAFAGDADFPPAVSAATLIKPKVYLTNPAAPSHARLNTGFSVYGYLKPHHTSGTYPVRIYKYRYSSGTWRSYGYTSAKASNYSSFTKYSRLISLPKTGRWRLRTYTPADSGHAATWSSGYDYVVVR
jgi:beta propeller repeat protein